MLDNALRQSNNNDNNNAYRSYSSSSSYRPTPQYNQYQTFLRLWSVFKITSPRTLSLQFFDTYDRGETLHPICHDVNPERARFGGAQALNHAVAVAKGGEMR